MEQKYTTYFLTQKDGTKKPIRRKVRDERAWKKACQLTRMRKSIAVEVCFTANYDQLSMLRFMIEYKLGETNLYNLPQLTKALDDAKQQVNDLTEKEYNEGRYSEWFERFSKSW
jgi:hypothetical protein